MTRAAVLPALRAATYARHPLHAEDRVWVERNCYADVFVELLHALALEPRAMLGHAAAVDFEGDGFTFFKPSHDELRDLYGVDVQELNVWRTPLEHALEHLGAGKFIATEADAFWLPDTAGTDYRQQPVKTTIVLNAVDVAARRAGYFHNAGYFELEGEDFDRTFAADARPLPLYAELVRIDRLVRRPADELRRLARARLAVHAARAPRENPVRRWGARFAHDLPELQALGLPHYHRWAFATTRQLGAAMELLAAHLEWLAGDAAPDAADAALRDAAADFGRVSTGAKAFILKAARAVHSGRPLDAAPLFDEMATAWDDGMARLPRGA